MHPYGPRFVRLLKLLKEEAPLSLPLRVYVTSSFPSRYSSDSEDCGLHVAHIADDLLSHSIYINSDIGLEAALDTLIHEYAHALDTEVNGHTGRVSHRASWGVQYARLYNLYHGRH